MTKRLGIYFILFWALVSLLFTVSCATTKEKPVEEVAVIEKQPVVSPKVEEPIEEVVIEEDLSARELAERKAELRDKFVNEDVHFEFDKSTLLPGAREILKEKAEWLFMETGVSVTIEGHCDERGTNEYNLALGDRRAESAKRFLVDLGISARRITTVSYGEERPLDSGHNEEAWAKNRRAHFVAD